jgi:hypothetical protein
VAKKTRDFWVILGGKRPLVYSFELFAPIATIFDTTDIHFYGSLSIESDVVGFCFHSTLAELSRGHALPNVEEIPGSSFPGFLIASVPWKVDVQDNGEELFGDVSLCQNSDGAFAFLFHRIDEYHPLYLLFGRECVHR